MACYLRPTASGTLATIALIAGHLAPSSLAGIMAILVALGFWHARRTDEATELVTHTSHANVKGLATV